MRALFLRPLVTHLASNGKEEGVKTETNCIKRKPLHNNNYECNGLGARLMNHEPAPSSVDGAMERTISLEVRPVCYSGLKGTKNNHVGDRNGLIQFNDGGGETRVQKKMVLLAFLRASHNIALPASGFFLAGSDHFFSVILSLSLYLCFILFCSPTPLSNSAHGLQS